MTGPTCRPDCTVIACGDGIFDPGEQCDDHNGVSGDGCSSTCRLETICGNAVREGFEQCDDGDTMSGDGCSSSCRWEYCGNGTTDVGGTPSEMCDDGNNASGDGCSSTCQDEPVCGDGMREGNEHCDDGNTTSGDGCSSSCRVEHYCGDGVRDTGEQCDDGNMNSGDGCSSNCTRRGALNKPPRRRERQVLLEILGDLGVLAVHALSLSDAA